MQMCIRDRGTPYYNLFQPEVKLMITDSHGIIAHKVHHPDFHLAPEKIVIGSTLRNVAAVKEQDIRILGTEIFQKSSAAYHLSLIHIWSAVDDVRCRQWVDSVLGTLSLKERIGQLYNPRQPYAATPYCPCPDRGRLYR